MCVAIYAIRRQVEGKRDTSDPCAMCMHAHCNSRLRGMRNKVMHDNYVEVTALCDSEHSHML